MASLMEDFLSSGATAYPSNAVAKEMLKEIPALSDVKVASLKTGVRSRLSTKASPTRSKAGER